MFFDFLVLSIIFFAALAWGGNEPWAMAIVAAVSLVALAGRLLWDSRGGRIRLDRSWVFLPMLLFLMYVGLQMVLSRVDLAKPFSNLPHTVEPYTTHLYLLLAIAYFAQVFAVSHGCHSRKQIKRLVLGIIALGIFEALYGLLQYLGGYGYIWNYSVGSDVARGTFLNRNHFALLLNFSLCTGVGYLYYRSVRLLRGRNPTLHYILRSPGFFQLAWISLWLAFIGLALMMSMSRMGIVAMLGSLGVMWVAGRISGSVRRTTALAASLLIVILGLAIYTGTDAILARYQGMGEAGYFERDRVPIWRDAFRMIRENPIVGTGLGTFPWTFGAFEQHQPDVPARYAHNDYLQALAEVGAVGLIILAAAFVLCWKTAVRNLRFRGDPLVRGIGLTTLGVLTAVALQELTDFSLYIPGVASCLAVLLGLNLRASRLAREEPVSTIKNSA
jgi:O-antigen ligase